MEDKERQKLYPQKMQLFAPEDFPISSVFYERNIMTMPLFSSSKKDVGTNRIIDIAVRTREGEGRWSVTPNVRFGCGGPADEKCLCYLLKIISEKRKPVLNPIDIGSLKSMYRCIHHTEPGGNHLNDLKNILRRMCGLMITATLSFYDKAGSKFLRGRDEGNFHLLEGVCFRDEILPNGEAAESNYIYMSQPFLRNINTRYTVPIDYDFYINLKPDSAKSLFKTLVVSFFAVRFKKVPVRYRYSTICDRLVIGRRPSLSQAKQQLGPAIKSLSESRYLDSSRWVELPHEKKDWYIYFWAGPLAHKYSKLVPEKETLTENNSFIDGDQNQSAIQQPLYAPPPPLLSGSDDTDESIRHFLNYYERLFSLRFKDRAFITYDRDAKIIRDLLSVYPLQKLKQLLKIFINSYYDDFIKSSGYTLPVFKTVIQKLVVQYSSRQTDENARPRVQEITDEQRAESLEIIRGYKERQSNK